ncbi:hypothetical protein GX48_04073 [Paracoccidioides brasiliensis]|nr:hypothetical protein GX48_04073 [Paracoccidioides brasiliensis]
MAESTTAPARDGPSRSPNVQGVLGRLVKAAATNDTAQQWMQIHRYIDTDTRSPKYAEASRGPCSKVEPGLGPRAVSGALGTEPSAVQRAAETCRVQQKNGEEVLK